MKIIKLKIFLSGILLSLMPVLNGQTVVGSVDQFKSMLQMKNKNQSEHKVKMRATDSVELDLQIKVNENGRCIGNVVGDATSMFHVQLNGASVEGTLIDMAKKTAYKYYSNSKKEVMVREVDIDGVLCVEYDVDENVDADAEVIPEAAENIDAYALQSNPGATGVIMLDFDGETVIGSSWNGGATIVAAASGFDNNKVIEIWKLVSEDYFPFELNITTDEAVFQAAPVGLRMRCIFTPTNYFYPGVGGVAFLNSFNSTFENPCWVFNSSFKGASEAGSHEVGHTLRLRHDGRTTPSEEYYAGQGDWAPIMGVGYYRPVVQWSKGEYTNANRTEDDVDIIANMNGISYRTDDHGNTIGTATPLVVSGGTILAGFNTGVIERQVDKDIFSFTTASSGIVTLDLEPDPDYPNLNIRARLLNPFGSVLAVSDPLSDLSASFSEDLPAGTYFLEVDGVGEGNVLVDGYTDYGSLGVYSISGQLTSDPGQEPFTVQNIPGTIEAENYDLGGSGIAYYDSTPGNSGGQYRTDDVDIEVCSNGGYDVGWFASGEWTEYTIANTVAGNYNITIHFAGQGTIGGSNIGISLGGVNIGTAYLYDTGGWQNWQTVTLYGVTIPAGTNQILRLDYTGGYFNFDKVVFSSNSQTPFTVQNIPGTIEAENYDFGGEGIAYSDSDPSNNGGQFRADGVDIEVCSEGGYNLGWFADGEWTEYTIANTSGGTYNIAVRFASLNAIGGSNIKVILNGATLGTAWLYNTGGWQNWQTVTLWNISIPSGSNQILRLEYTGGNFNFNKIMIAAPSPEDNAIAIKSGGETTEPQSDAIPNEFSVENYPNPFNTTTTIAYNLPETSNVVLTVMDVNGKIIETLVNENQAAGNYSVDFSGENLTPGIYFYSIVTNNHSLTKQLILVE